MMHQFYLTQLMLAIMVLVGAGVEHSIDQNHQSKLTLQGAAVIVLFSIALYVWG